MPTDQEKMLKQLAENLSPVLDMFYEEPMCFFLCVFRPGEPGIADYISNAQRPDMIKALRESATKLEKKQDIPVTKGEA